MRLFLVLFLTTIFFSCSKADFNDNSKRNENWAYWVDEVSGEASWIPVTDETTVENGVYHLFFANGKLFEKGRLKNKVHVDTVFRYNEVGDIIKYQIHQKDTVLYVYAKDGDYLEKFRNGTIFEEGKLTNGIFNDNWTRYYENGQPRWIQNLINGTGKVIWYNESGRKLSEENKVNGKTDGVVKHWYENGQLKEESNWKNGIPHGLHSFYFENGNLEINIYWVNNKKEGKAEAFYSNGQIKQVQYYVDGELKGPFKQWNENGKIELDGVYDDGKLLGSIFKYHFNGALETKGFINDNVRLGVWEYYSDKGKLIKKIYFEGGKLLRVEKF